VLYENEIGTTSTDSWLLRISTLELSVTHLRLGKADWVEIHFTRFHVFERACHIVIEAQSKRTHYICATKWAGN